MDQVPEKISFPKTEEEILDYWKKIDAFQTSLKLSEGKPEYSFYDGPPFATGLPHYGHILAGTIKDTVTRYAHQTGHHVTRRFGWDTHGLPIEFEIDKLLGVKTREDVLKMGIPAYNAHCRSIVMKYSAEWESVITRLGRWIDFKNDYKTLDPGFMESVWWVFRRLYDLGLVYKGFKVMPYSTGCTTPLSNFESGLNYKEVSDPSVVIAFPLESDPSVSLLAWTTTPWTLPSNLALCVNPELIYVKLVDKASGQTYILAEKRLEQIYKKEKDPKKPTQYEIKESFKGATLKGLSYKPLFNYFVETHGAKAFRVVVDDYVKDDSGTGVVHQAPGFGEDDYRVCLANGVVSVSDIPCPLDADGKFLPIISDFAGQYIKDADKTIKANIKAQGRLKADGSIVHSYPFCWRSETPLIYRTVPSWFVAVEKIKAELLDANTKTSWVPDFVQEKRFHNWLSEARDWAVSRNRYWGTPIPIWSNDEGETVCIGSVEELEKLSGKKVTDLHRESVDDIEIPSSKGGKPLKRVEEVFDCWFESGSMPYAQLHYPFENKELFEKSFPADFIAEGLDQTRGWFYTLMVLSTALFKQPAFKNVIVNGLVLAEDGKKMSKRLKNYPDPLEVVRKYGADALRLYLINSPVVRAEPLRFKEAGVNDVIKDLFLPWYNAYRFLAQNISKFNLTEGEAGKKFVPDVSVALSSTNVMDKWILASSQSLVKFVRQEMAAYRLYTVIPRLVKFVEQLTNWYVRFNRKRLRGNNGQQEALLSLNTLFEVIYVSIRTMSPFTPFFTEHVYQNLKKALPASEQQDSVHYVMFPETIEAALNPAIEAAVGAMQSVIELGRAARDRRKLPIKFPLKELLVVSQNEQKLKDLTSLSSYITEELNLRKLVVTSDEASFVKLTAQGTPVLAKKLRKDFAAVKKEIESLSDEQLRKFLVDDKMTIGGHQIGEEDVKVTRIFRGDEKVYEATWDNELLVVLSIEVDEELKAAGTARSVVNRVQKFRKKLGLLPEDPIHVYHKPTKSDSAAHLVLVAQQDVISQALGAPFTHIGENPDPEHTESHEVLDDTVHFYIQRK